MSGTGWIVGTDPTDERLRRFGKLLYDCCRRFTEPGREMTGANCRQCIDSAWWDSAKGESNASDQADETARGNVNGRSSN